MCPDTPVPFERTFDAALGVVYEALAPMQVTGHFDVDLRHLDREGHVSLGTFTAVAEGAASLGTAAGVQPLAASGMSNDTTVASPVSDGRVTFAARPRAAAPDLWTWDVEFFCAGGATLAISTVRVAVRRS